MIQINVVTPETQSTEAYRVVPNLDDPVILQIQDRLIKVIDISATGITASASDLAPTQRYRFMLDLPTHPSPIEGMLETSRPTDAGTIQCKLLDLTPDQVDHLHHYVLRRQKEAIRSLKNVDK